MLQIQNVKKVYKTGQLVQRALDGVSLSLRDCEFVAILGPSGSGKTTLLNILGGLDRYDEGNLIINGVSTKQYNARDWDSYRNHSVGFVFQSYNLIPHQTVLSNVELALTISGISRAERRRRAREALAQVGLGDHMHKKPSQLSGGQMQRVAIARALVNDPDILLADEPTGALDSETSLQVMDLLKEVARDRLVVMVTHNPELAERYATRIVRLRDGRITDDSDPYDPAAEGAGVHKNLGRASMSFLTALTLSFNNLWTKKVRTLLVAFAGSIGIIGIAMILSTSNGVNRYIQEVQEETLKSYPLQITDTSFNLASMIPDRANQDDSDAEVREFKSVTGLISQVSVNDLASLRTFLESGETDVYDHAQAIEYSYGLTPQIFALDGDAPRQVNPDRSFAAMGFQSAENLSGMLSMVSSTDSFHAMPVKPELYRTLYEVKAGRWAEGPGELVLVLTAKGRVTDMALYIMGLKDPAELEEMIRAFAEGRTVESNDEELTFRYEDFLGISFRAVPAADFYSYDAEFGVWTDRSADEAFLQAAVDNGIELTVVGVVQPMEQSSVSTLGIGLAYHPSLIDALAERAEQSEIVQAQRADRATDVLTGKPFGETRNADEMDLSTLFSVDQDAIANAFDFDSADLGLDPDALDLSGLDFSGMDLSGTMDPSAFASALPGLSEAQLGELLSAIRFQPDPEVLEPLFRELVAGYLTREDTQQTLTGLREALSGYLTSEAAAQVLEDGIRDALAENGAVTITAEDVLALVTEVLAGYPDYLAAHGIEGEDLPLTYLGEYLQSEEGRAALEAAAETLRQRAEAFVLSPAQIRALTDKLYAGFEAYVADQDLPTGQDLLSSLGDYLATPRAAELLQQAVLSSVDTSGLEQKAAALISGYTAGLTNAISALMQTAMTEMSRQLTTAIAANLEQMTARFADNLQDAFRIDPEALAEAFTMNMDASQLRDLMTTLLSKEQNSYDGNLRKLGWRDVEKPSMITIYPKDFDGKGRIKEILEQYNARAEAEGREGITYTDIVDTLMSSVTTIVNAISGVLIAFVAISLVVSSVMIGVITYISVLERRKEIGILRAIGASKRNVSQVFNAETFIIGALAGLLGVGLTYLLLIPTNQIIAGIAEDVPIHAYLPLQSAGILVLLSILLTLLGGLIPSRKAARSDPVAALRSE